MVLMEKGKYEMAAVIIIVLAGATILSSIYATTQTSHFTLVLSAKYKVNVSGDIYAFYALKVKRYQRA